MEVSLAVNGEHHLAPLVVQGPPFGCIVADPPWKFGNQRTRGATDNHYPTMEFHEIAALTIHGWAMHQVAAPDSHLYLWTTASHLPDALLVMRVWGFNYVQDIVPWYKVKNDKLQMGLGNYWRHAQEICLFGVRGKAPALDHSQLDVIVAERCEHSAKPEELQDRVEKLSPGPFLEVFARRQRPGWYCYGNQL